MWVFILSGYSYRFSDAYLGVWDSVEEYVEQYIEDTDMLHGMPENLRYYFDTEAFARDLELNGDIWTHRANGVTHVFSAL